MDLPGEQLTYAAVLEAETQLFQVKCAYLTQNGWQRVKYRGELIEPARWHTVRPWGTESSKRVEADTNDAVRAQARWDSPDDVD